MTNKKGEKLYQVIKTCSNSIDAIAVVETWDKAMEWINRYEDVNDDRWFRKIITKNVREGIDAELEFIENRKGWGYDYMVRIVVGIVFVN